MKKKLFDLKILKFKPISIDAALWRKVFFLFLSLCPLIVEFFENHICRLKKIEILAELKLIEVDLACVRKENKRILAIT